MNVKSNTLTFSLQAGSYDYMILYPPWSYDRAKSINRSLDTARHYILLFDTRPNISHGHLSNVTLMSVHRLRRWTNIKVTLGTRCSS